MFVDDNIETGSWSPEIACCRGCELWAFVHGDDFIVTGDPMQLAWAESRLMEELILKRQAVLGLDDGDDKMVTILNRLVTWVCLSGSRKQIEIAADPSLPEILLAQVNLDGANLMSVATPTAGVDPADAHKA